MSADVIVVALAVVGTIASVAGFALAGYYWYARWRWERSLNWDDVLGVAERLLVEIETSGWKPDIVIGLGRSGGIWGGWLAGNLGTLPFGVVDLKYIDGPNGREVSFPAGEEILTALLPNDRQANRVLIIEGACSTGKTFREFRKTFGERFDQSRMKVAVLYQSSTCDEAIDFAGLANLEPWPRRFPWHERSAYRPYIGALRRLVPDRSESPT